MYSWVYGFRRHLGQQLLIGKASIRKADRRRKSNTQEEVAETAFCFIFGGSCYIGRISHTFKFDFSRVFKVVNPVVASPRRSSGRMDSLPRLNKLFFDEELSTSFASERANN